LIQGVIRGRAGTRDRADTYVDVCCLIFKSWEDVKSNQEEIMKKVLVLTTAWFATPQSPDHYELHRVSYGETMESIVKDANQNSDVDYDIREAVAEAVAQSKKMEGGATSRQLQVGDKVAVPIYRR